MSSLPLKVELGHREPADRYLARLAARNFCDPAELCSDLGLAHFGIIRGCPEAIGPLADLGGVELQSLCEWSPHHISGSRTLFRGWKFPRRWFSQPIIQHCPICLGRSGTSQGHWAFDLNFVCLEHGIWLSGAHERVEINAYDLWLEQRLLGRKSPIWLDAFSLPATLEFCMLLGRRLYLDEFPRFSNLDRRQIRRIISGGFDVASAGPDRIRACFADWQSEPVQGPEGPQSIFGPLFTNLQRYGKGEEFAPFKDLLRNHILQTMPIAAGTELLGQRVEYRRLHSVATAAEAYGIQKTRLRAILADRSLVPGIESGLADIRAIFDAQKAAPLLQCISQAVGVQQIQLALNITPSQLMTLRQSGYLGPEFDGEGYRPLWSLRDALEFMEKLQADSIAVADGEDDRQPIGVVASRLRVSPGQILKLRLDGALAPFGRRIGQSGYQSLLVRADSVLEHLQRGQSDHMNFETFGNLVGIRWPQVRRLVLNGLCPAQELRNPASGAMQLYITRADFEVFKARYATLNLLRQETGLSWQRIAKTLRDQGVAKVTLDGKDFGSLYHRSDLPAGLRTHG